MVEDNNPMLRFTSYLALNRYKLLPYQLPHTGDEHNNSSISIIQ